MPVTWLILRRVVRSVNKIPDIRCLSATRFVVGDTVVVNPRPEPSLRFRHDRVVLVQDYADRASALGDVGL